jgi:hypothetical protein
VIRPQTGFDSMSQGMTEPPEPSSGPPPRGAESGETWGRLFALLETRVVPALERIAAALENPSAAAEPIPSRFAMIAEVRRSIHEGDFVRAQETLSDLSLDHPDAPEVPAIVEELARARILAINDRRKRLDAARSSNDPDAVLTLRDHLAEVLDARDRDPLDRDIVRWIMGILMKRLRTGTVAPDVAILAARVADAFGHLNEGASLRASLPTLRRSAGLCARCAKPYTGVEDACPECLAASPKIATLPETPSPLT